MANEKTWIKRMRANPAAKRRLICLPHAGGGAWAFRTWPDALPADVEVLSVQLPGREDRLTDEPLDAAAPIVRTVADVLAGSLDRPYAIYGHSMGALLGFELLRELRRRGAAPAERLFAAAYRAPQVPSPDPPIFHLPDGEFVEEVDRRYDAVPPAARADPELMELVLPGLRADVAVCDTYAYVAEEPLDCPISVFGGVEDRAVQRPELEAWSQQTTAEFDLTMFPGDHFFLQSSFDALMRAVVERLPDATS